MNAARLSHEIDAEHETPMPTLVLTRTQKEPHAASSPSRADDASLSELRRSGRFRVTVATGPSRSIFTFSMTRGPYHTADERRKRG